MITFKDYFFYTPLLNPGTVVIYGEKAAFKGVTQKEYEVIKEDVRRETKKVG